jgi:sedoheptulose-bisphosphatase
VLFNRIPYIYFVLIFFFRDKGKTFAPGNLRATADNERYRNLVNYWIDNKYTLRYSGGLVPDVYHILLKGEGVLANASSLKAKAKLRLLFECAPIAFLVEMAGGLSCFSPSEIDMAASTSTSSTPPPPSSVEGAVSVLDVVVSDLDKRIGVCFGSVEEVQRFFRLMNL